MIINQDCLEWMRSQPDHSIDVVVSSPPYNIGIAYNTYNDRKHDYVEWQHQVWNQVCRLLKPEGHLFLNIASTRQDPLRPYRVVEGLDWQIQNTIVWAKAIEFKGHIYGRSTVNINSRYALPNGWEFVFHLTSTGKTDIDTKASAVPYRPEYAEDNFNRTGRTHRPTTTCWHIPYETTGYMGQSSASLKGEKTHPAIFPRELVRHCLRVAGAQPHHIIYDPFGGTGTTAVVAKEFGCEYVITEIDPDYCDFIKERLKCH